jgi:hypothetical protein
MNLSSGSLVKTPNNYMRSLFICLVTLIASIGYSVTAAPADPHDRCAFIGLTNFADFTKSTSATPGELVLTSPELAAPINWDELVASWNVVPGEYIKAEARAIFPDHTTKWFMLSQWSDNPALHPRASEAHQRDADGTVSIDTLMLKRHGGKVQLRLTLGGADLNPPLKFLGLSFCDSDAHPAERAPNKAAWGKTVEVPQRRQGEYPQQDGWCSPTSLSMVLAYWSDDLHRPELNHTELDVATNIQDSVLKGTGNWPFNTAYAGAFSGIRAYVTRLDDITELEDWIAVGITPIISVSSFINVKHQGADEGHLIVCVGFTDTGDVVVNDPAASVKRNEHARRVYGRQHVIDCWKKSKNAVYLVYPEGAAIPKNTLGHWADN